MMLSLLSLLLHETTTQWAIVTTRKVQKNSLMTNNVMGWWLSMLCYDGMMIIYAMLRWDDDSLRYAMMGWW